MEESPFEETTDREDRGGGEEEEKEKEEEEKEEEDEKTIDIDLCLSVCLASFSRSLHLSPHVLVVLFLSFVWVSFHL